MSPLFIWDTVVLWVSCVFSLNMLVIRCHRLLPFFTNLNCCRDDAQATSGDRWHDGEINSRWSFRTLVCSIIPLLLHISRASQPPDLIYSIILQLPLFTQILAGLISCATTQLVHFNLERAQYSCSSTELKSLLNSRTIRNSQQLPSAEPSSSDLAIKSKEALLSLKPSHKSAASDAKLRQTLLKFKLLLDLKCVELLRGTCAVYLRHLCQASSESQSSLAVTYFPLRRVSSISNSKHRSSQLSRAKMDSKLAACKGRLQVSDLVAIEAAVAAAF